MVISASRRTDIPAYFSDWFFQRLKEGYALVRNPVSFHKISRVSLALSDVDCFVFWTKNPASMLPRLGELAGYNYYFQFTLTPYGRDIEPGLPPRREFIDTFKKLSDMIGPERVIWRYDPILLSEKYSLDFHEENFAEMAENLKGCTEKCVISFIDMYSRIEKNMSKLGARALSDGEKRDIAARLFKAAFACGIKMETCAEQIELSDLGIGHASCIDPRLISRVTGMPFAAPKDRSQRPACGCAESVDIGAYGTCRSGCGYCYAGGITGERSREAYDKHSPLLCSSVDEGDEVAERKMTNCKKGQMSFLE